MHTLRLFESRPAVIPMITASYLADLGESRGKQTLFTKQSPERLRILREHALIESAVSSNRIEGVHVDESRVKAIVLGKGVLHDRSEEEVRGYRDALKLIHERSNALSISRRTILKLHKTIRGETWDAGKLKERDGDIEKYPDGRVRVRFKPVAAKQTPAVLDQTVKLWSECEREQWVPPLVALAGLNLDFLCIHPFRDGNGRVSRLLMLLQTYRAGYEAGRYVSFERLIEQNKERYYETLEKSSQGWHDGRHDPWHYINFVLYILKSACKDFENRAVQSAEPKGTKAEMVIQAIKNQTSEFRIGAIERACPNVGREWIRRVLAELREAGVVRCVGRGVGARWHVVVNKRTTLK